MIWLANASVKRMASCLIKPNTLYHMALRGFLTPFLFVSLQSDWFLFHFFISSVSEYLVFHSFFFFFLRFYLTSHWLLPFWLMHWFQLILSFAILNESDQWVRLSSMESIFFILLCFLLLLLSCSEDQNMHTFILLPGAVRHTCLWSPKIKLRKVKAETTSASVDHF